MASSGREAGRCSQSVWSNAPWDQALYREEGKTALKCQPVGVQGMRKAEFVERVSGFPTNHRQHFTKLLPGSP